MMRALFLSLGAFVGLWGLSLFAVDGVLLHLTDETLRSRMLHAFISYGPGGEPMINPPDWVGYTFVGMGGLTMLYSVALPRA